MYVLREVKKLINSSSDKPFKITFGGMANIVTLATIDKLVKLGCTITRKRNNLIIERK